MSKLEDYEINHSSCTLTSCVYGIEIDCDACQAKMLEEHDAEIRRKTIEEVNKLEKTRWIPCSERLPEDRRTVLVTAYWHETYQVMEACYFGDGLWWCVPYNNCGEHMQRLNPKAWMPLPEPYKGE